MLTIFTIPKPFIGIDDIHQRNAIQSWLAIRPECEIILCGNDQGVAEAAKEYGVVHIPDIPVNEFGTPYLNEAFMEVQRLAKHEVVCYANADIIFPPNLYDVMEQIPFVNYLIVGRRYNMDITEIINFQSTTEQDQFFRLADKSAELHHMGGSDYFIFKKGSIVDIPPFVVGRPFWDNWMIYKARMNKWPVVDATAAILAVHQNHGYAHVINGDDRWHGPEGDQNFEFVNSGEWFNLWDSTLLMNKSGSIYKVKGEQYLKRKIQTLPVLKPRTGIGKKWQMFIKKILMALYYRRKWIPYPLLNFAVSVATKIQ